MKIETENKIKNILNEIGRENIDIIELYIYDKESFDFKDNFFTKKLFAMDFINAEIKLNGIFYNDYFKTRDLELVKNEIISIL